MIRTGKSQIFAIIYGDWHQVITAARNSRDVRDVLLDMKPDSEEDDHQEYWLPASSMYAWKQLDDMFGRNGGCSVELAMVYRDSGGFVESTLRTKGLYRSDTNTAVVRVLRDENKLVAAIDSAIKVLKNAKQ